MTFAVDPERGTFILVLLGIFIGGALLLFALRASTISEGERFRIASREGALVFNNVMLSAILAIVLLGTLYPLLTEAFDVRVSVGPPYFNPVGAIFAIPMLVVMGVGPLLRWRQDRLDRIGKDVALFGALVLAALILASVLADIGILPLLGLALGLGLAVASLLPLRRRKLSRTPLATWGMVVAHFGIAVALLGMSSESAFTQERLAALEEGGRTSVGPWSIELQGVEPIAGPNWTAMQARISARYDGGKANVLTPQARNFWAPPQQTTESALLTRWTGQLSAVVGDRTPDGRWQLRLWWKPFVPLIWYGGLLVALGGVLALIGRVITDIRNRRLAVRIAERRADREALA